MARHGSRPPRIGRSLGTLAAITLGAAAAPAQDYASFEVEASLDNAAWSKQPLFLGPNPTTVYVRVRARHSNPGAVAAFAGATFQPIIEAAFGTFAGVTLRPLTTAGTGAGVSENASIPANLGRINYFAHPPMNTSSNTGLLVAHADNWRGLPILRYAGANATTPEVGISLGVQVAQYTSFNTNPGPTLFKFAFDIAPLTGPQMVFIDLPHALVNSREHPVARWFTTLTGTGSPRSFLVDPAATEPILVYAGGSPCAPNFHGAILRHPKDSVALAGRRASFAVETIACSGPATFQWFHDGDVLTDGGRYSGVTTRRLIINDVASSDAGAYTVHAVFGPSLVVSAPGVLSIVCRADLDDGSMTGTRDGGVGIDDLLYFLSLFDAGNLGADLDDGSMLGVRDQGVSIDDLLYMLARFEAGC